MSVLRLHAPSIVVVLFMLQAIGDGQSVWTTPAALACIVVALLLAVVELSRRYAAGARRRLRRR